MCGKSYPTSVTEELKPSVLFELFYKAVYKSLVRVLLMLEGDGIGNPGICQSLGYRKILKANPTVGWK